MKYGKRNCKIGEPETNLQRGARRTRSPVWKELQLEEGVQNWDLFPDQKRGSRLAQAKSVADGQNCPHGKGSIPSCMATDGIGPGDQTLTPACPEGSSLPIRGMARKESVGFDRRCNVAPIALTERRINYLGRVFSVGGSVDRREGASGCLCCLLSSEGKQ